MTSATTSAGATTTPAPAADESVTFTKALILLLLITVAMHINHFLKVQKFKYIGETAMYILIGFVVAAFWTGLSYDDQNLAIQMDAELFYLVLLPPIIFEGGYTLSKIAFFQNFPLIILLAFVGAFYSTMITSILMYFFSKLVSPWSFVESLVFGSLISSTDPVTVLSLLPADVDRRLYMLMFGESALNDAVAIILYRFFTSIADPHMHLDAGSFFWSAFLSFLVFVGSFLVGVTLAMVFALLTKNVHVHHDEVNVYQVCMLLVFAYSSYLVAEACHLTGIISVFFCGIAMAHYAHPNLSPMAAKSWKVILRAISHMFEAFIFLYLGLGISSFGGKTNYNYVLIFFAIISILVSRTHVFLLLPIARILPKERPIPFNQQFLIWFSGLRGAVAFALGVTFLEHRVFSEHIKGQIFGTTVMVIVFTVIVFGGLMPYMLVWLKITAPEVPEEELEQGAGYDKLKHGKEGEHGATAAVAEEEEDGPEVASDSDMEQPLFGWLYNFDKKYIMPYFTKPKEERSDASHDALEARPRPKSKGPSHAEIPLEGGKPGSPRLGLEQSAFLKSSKAEDIMLETVNLN